MVPFKTDHSFSVRKPWLFQWAWAWFCVGVAAEHPCALLHWPVSFRSQILGLGSGSHACSFLTCFLFLQICLKESHESYPLDKITSNCTCYCWRLRLLLNEEPICFCVVCWSIVFKILILKSGNSELKDFFIALSSQIQNSDMASLLLLYYYYIASLLLILILWLLLLFTLFM